MHIEMYNDNVNSQKMVFPDLFSAGKSRVGEATPVVLESSCRVETQGQAEGGLGAAEWGSAAAAARLPQQSERLPTLQRRSPVSHSLINCHPLFQFGHNAESGYH